MNLAKEPIKPIPLNHEALPGNDKNLEPGEVYIEFFSKLENENPEYISSSAAQLIVSCSSPSRRKELALSRSKIAERACQWWGGSAEDFEVQTSKSGQPRLKDHRSDTSYFLSISHCRTWVGYALSLDMELGLDIENIDRFASLVTSREQRWLHKQEIEQAKTHITADSLCELWTAKEAYTKKLGTGISQGFDSFSVESLVDKGLFFQKIELPGARIATLCCSQKPTRIHSVIGHC